MYKHFGFLILLLALSCVRTDDLNPSLSNHIFLEARKNYVADSLSGIRIKGWSLLQEANAITGVIDTFIKSDSIILPLSAHLKGVHEIRYSITVTTEDEILGENALGDWIFTVRGSESGEFRFGLFDFSESTELFIETCFEFNNGNIAPIPCQ